MNACAAPDQQLRPGCCAAPQPSGFVASVFVLSGEGIVWCEPTALALCASSKRPAERQRRAPRARVSSMSEAGDDDDDFAAGQVNDRTQHLRSQFAAAVADILDGKGDDSEARPRPTRAFAQQLTEVAWQWTTTALAPDLESSRRPASV